MTKSFKYSSNSVTDGVSFGLLTYLSRSGSTFLSNFLNEYEDICVTIEASLPPELFGIAGYKQPILKDKEEVFSYLRSIFKVSKLRTWPINIDHVWELVSCEGSTDITGDRLLRSLLLDYRNKVKPNARIILFKGTPIMPWYVPNLPRHMKNWKIIHLIRDPRSVYASQKRNFKPYTQKKFAYSPFEVAYDWKRGVRSTECCYRKIMNIKYEDLILKPDFTLQEILKFLEVTSLRSDSNNFKQLIPEEEQSIHTKVEKKPDRSRIDSWKRNW